MKKRVSLVLAIIMVLTLLPATAFADSSNMHASNDIIKTIKSFESFSPTPYKAVAGEAYLTVGYGHNGPDVTEDMEISEAEAVSLLKGDLAFFEKAVNTFFSKHNLSYSQQVFDAVLSLTYNIGADWLKSGSFRIKSYLINGLEKYDEFEIADAFASICSSSGSIYPSLIKRRIREARILLYGDYSGKDSPDYTYLILNTDGGTPCSGSRVVIYPKDLPYGSLPGAYKEGFVLASWRKEDGTDLNATDIAAEGLKLKAVWESGTPETYTLSVSGGSGSGTYAEGETVSLFPGRAYSGKFMVWQSGDIRIITADGGYKFRMPAHDLTITSLSDYDCEGRFCPSDYFSDISSKFWAHDAIDFVCHNDLFKGFSETIFKPNAVMSRGMLMSVLYRMNGSPSVEGYVNPFSDVRDNSPYHDAILWAYHNHIASGYDGGVFSPNSILKREHIAVFLMRYSLHMGYGIFENDESDESDESDGIERFSDAELVSDYAKEAICWASANGIISGTSKTALSPHDGATRAQVAVMVTRFVRNVAAVASVEDLA